MANNLKKYNQKRNFQKTKEPVGVVKKTHKKLRFVVQHHLARKDHYDFRLEWQGVLKSWAVPKGPSYNSKDKRLAIMVEDHPLSYRTFEGTIPKGEYGAGTVMLWDEGYWEPLENIPHSFKVKTFKFILYGKRLQGRWTLIQFQDTNWLLIKEKDNISLFNDITKIKTSIKTGRTMDEIKNNQNHHGKTSRQNNIIENITITNPDKVIFSRPKITKMDIVWYYHKVAPRMIPLIKKRIISTIACPNGLKGEKFFKKHLENKHEGLGQITLPTEEPEKNDYYYLLNSEGLISEVQRNSFEFHIWGSTVKTLEYPNMMVFDLDPDEKLNIQALRQGVKDLKKILDGLNLKSYLKTSGGKGYHIVVPIKEKMNWEDFREFAHNVALLMEAKWPNKYTSNIRKKERKGKIFIDWIRNTKSATFVAPYSIRLRKGAPVSMPIRWSELDKIKPNEITMDLALKRLKRKDPWADFPFLS